ncbi:MAG: glycoside hydrolase family 2 protein [Verrucomicrobiota bacterium]
MLRLFPQHQIRETESLDGLWTYYFPQNGCVIAPDAPLSDDLEKLKLAVPGVWEIHPERVNYRGQALAVREIVLEKAGALRLVFAGVSHTCTVYWNGPEVAHHHNAYTAFDVVIPDCEPGRHELRLHITNEHGELSALHIPNDYYNYGGISRPVELQRLPAQGAFIERLHLTPEVDSDPRRLRAVAHIRNFSAQDFSGELSLISPEGTESALGVAVAAGQTAEVDAVLHFAQTPLWSPEQPHLVYVKAELQREGLPVDDLTERTGLRTVGTEGRKIILNGAPIRLAGFNRHEDHPDFGCALPLPMMLKDIELMRGMGANAVRTSHYPNDSRFLDLCDEWGLLVFEENHARGLRDEKFEHPRLREQCLACNEEMVTQHFNHPSIVMWGILNECMSDSEAGRMVYKEQFDQLRALDPSRPLTYATFRMREDLCQDLPDICSWNQYPNWYIHMKPNESLDIIFEHQDAHGLADRPLMVSEFGAGAIPGYRDPIRKGKWSEERQCELLEELLADYTQNPRVEGLFIWQFCDIRVDESWAMQRPRTMNNKGIVDEYRRPKLSAAVVKRYFEAWLKG